ncbi:hypothetical protein, partial [Brevibacterium paucivorans]|uniref:hypothetical protein n=1 Tax=Brevibacterium paucivorans TaxID=170994 RepID=UPI0015E0A859
PRPPRRQRDRRTGPGIRPLLGAQRTRRSQAVDVWEEAIDELSQQTTESEEEDPTTLSESESEPPEEE